MKKDKLGDMSRTFNQPQGQSAKVLASLVGWENKQHKHPSFLHFLPASLAIAI